MPIQIRDEAIYNLLQKIYRSDRT